MSSKVYFSKEITPESVLNLFSRLGKDLPGKVAIKVHSGEPGNQNFLKPEFWKPVIDHVGGTVVECNTAYDGGRNTTDRHMQTMQKHGWCDNFPVEILDSEGPDLVFEIPEGKSIQKNFVGKNITKYDSCLVLSHFKGHPVGGYGGALKQLAIGFASGYGKKYIHGSGNSDNPWRSDPDAFKDAMADAASTVIRYFDGRIVYINAMKNMSVDCDCCSVAEDPCMDDIGVLISTDPVAIDQACLDLVYASNDPGKDHLIERIESRNGIRTIEAATALGIGSREYELIEI